MIPLGIGSLSGLLFLLSIPKADLEFLAWVCLLPGFLALPRASRRRLFLIGLAWGIVAGIGRAYWLSDTLQLYGEVPASLSILTTALLISYLALYPAVFYCLAARIEFSSPWFSWVAAALWVLLEWIQGWAFTGFPWEFLGYSQYLNLPLIQVASIAGVYGVSYLIVLANATLAQLVYLGPPGRRWLLCAGPPAVVLACVLVYGHLRLHAPDSPAHDPLRVAIVQGNISQDQKWKYTRIAETTQHYVDLTRTLAGSRLDLIIFPETALPFYFREERYAAARQAIADLAHQLGTPILIGSLEGAANPPSEVYNRAFLMDVDGAIVDYYDKIHLVPFGEYLPLSEIFQYLGGLTAESGSFAPGQRFAPLNLPGQNLPFGVFICYESTFPQIARTLARHGAAFLITTTNDAWFGRSAAPYQHFSMAVLRAVETGRPVLRAANTGISGLISPTGEILKATELFETTAFTVTLQPHHGATFYTRYGDLFLFLCGVLLSGASLRHFSQSLGWKGMAGRSERQRPEHLLPK